jgi:hypothetical protein
MIGVDTRMERSLLESTILVLSLSWLLSFFDQSLFPGIPHTGILTDVLTAVIVVLILFRFLM